MTNIMWFEHLHTGLRLERYLRPSHHDHHRKYTILNTRRKKVNQQAQKKPIEELHTKVPVHDDTYGWTLLHAQNVNLQVQSDDHDDFVMVDPEAFH